MLAILLAVACAASGQPPGMTGTPAARAAFDRGEAALRGNRWNNAVSQYGKAIELDPEFFQAHAQYYFACTAGGNYRNEPLHKQFETRYLQAARKHPEEAVYPYILALFYQYKDPGLTVRYLEQSVKLDPGFAPAWSALAFIVAGQGKLAESREHARTAAAAWPNSALYGMLAVRAMQSAGFAPALRAAENYANAFPDQAASILEYVARTAPTPEDARAVYELLRQRHLPAAAGALEPLFHIYLREDPAKALTLARQIAKPALAVYAQAIINANTALAAGSPAEALSTLDALNLPPLADRRTLELTRAKAREATGDIAPAYAQLLAYFATAPSDETRAALLTLGRRLDKDPVQVEDEVFAQRAKSARPGIAFSAAPFTQGPPFSLAGLKDKVFLLNFWYPLCGPCRGEFQFLQDVLEKYRDRGFAIIAVNAHPTEDSWVLPLFRGWGLGFLPAHGSESILKTYNVTAFPSSFLYGPDGRIYYTPGPVGNAEARRELELHVEALLNHRFPE